MVTKDNANLLLIFVFLLIAKSNKLTDKQVAAETEIANQVQTKNKAVFGSLINTLLLMIIFSTAFGLVIYTMFLEKTGLTTIPVIGIIAPSLAILAWAFNYKFSMVESTRNQSYIAQSEKAITQYSIAEQRAKFAEEKNQSQFGQILKQFEELGKEREKLKAQGEKTASDLKAQGEKTASDLKAQGEKTASDLKAQGEKILEGQKAQGEIISNSLKQQGDSIRNELIALLTGSKVLNDRELSDIKSAIATLSKVDEEVKKQINSLTQFGDQ